MVAQSQYHMLLHIYLPVLQGAFDLRIHVIERQARIKANGEHSSAIFIRTAFTVLSYQMPQKVGSIYIKTKLLQYFVCTLNVKLWP